MQVPSDEEVLKWFREKFPQESNARYWNNVKLARIFWEREHRARGGSEFNSFEKKKIGEVEVGEFVELQGIVADIRDRKRQGCPRCWRKACDCGERKVELINRGFLLGDEEDVIYVEDLPKTKNDLMDIKIGDEIVVKGQVVSGYKGRKELKVSEWQKVERLPESAELLLNRLRETGDLALSVFRQMVKSRGLDIKVFEPYVEVFESGDGSKFVRVRE